MKYALRAALKNYNWYDWLPWVLQGLRMAPKEELLACSVELVYGQTLWVPGEFVPDINNPWYSPRNSPTLRSHVSTFIQWCHWNLHMMDQSRIWSPIETGVQSQLIVLNQLTETWIGQLRCLWHPNADESRTLLINRMCKFLWILGGLCGNIHLKMWQNSHSVLVRFPL